ncbi:unnamed protein product [Trichogramma brassicae]|uniref:Uncharacterized protein n=1 Tax=Trichogramma brassicae TaxID=86971 RepID=A0A6H5J5D2_9HYME|nr:unnamed protein product [Trichogramma brassicae]
MKIQVIYQNEKADFCPNEDGYLTLKALRERFPKTDGLSFKNSEGKRIILTPCDERIKINQSVDVYDVHTEIHLGDDDDYVPAVKKSKSVDKDEICIIEAKNGNGNVTDKEDDRSKSVDDESVESHDVEMKSEVDEVRDDKKSDDAQEKDDSSDDKMDEDITAVDSKPEIEESKQIDSSESQLADKTDDVAESEQEQLVTDEKSPDESAPIVEIKKDETHGDAPQEKEMNFETESESKIDTDLTDSQMKPNSTITKWKYLRKLKNPKRFNQLLAKPMKRQFLMKMEVSSEIVEPVTSEAKKDTVEEDSKEVNPSTHCKSEKGPKDVSTRDATEQKTKFSPTPSPAAIGTESNVTNASESSDNKTESVSRPKIGSCRQNSADHKCVPKIENGVVVMKCSEECHTEAMVETKVGLVYESVTSELKLKSSAKKEESSDDSVESEKSSGDDEKDKDNETEESESSDENYKSRVRIARGPRRSCGGKPWPPPGRYRGGKCRSPPRRRCGIISGIYTSPSDDLNASVSTATSQSADESNVDNSESEKGSPATPKKTRGRQSRSASKTPKLLTKVLRVGWLNRATPNDKYEPMEKPLGNCQKLKLVENKIYTALDIKQMAVKKFTGRKKFDLDELYHVQLGHVGTADDDGEAQIIDEFAKPDGSICDIWGYCRANNTTPYKLKLSLLTTAKNPNRTIVATPARSRSVRRICSAPTRPQLHDNVRIYYEYAKVSKYTNDRSVTEMEIDELLLRVREDNHGSSPQIIENFDPLNFGYTISRVEVDGKQLLHVITEDDGRVSYEYHESVVDPEPHRILFDTDVVSGSCRGHYGVGVVLSCTHLCSPVITWYKDDVRIKGAEHMYWMRDVFNWLDDETHVWHCTIKCKEMKKPLRSKNVMINEKTVTQRSSRV